MLRLIFGFVFLVFLLFSVYFYSERDKKEKNRNIDDQFKFNPEGFEKVKVLKSRDSALVKLTNRDVIPILYLTLVFVIDFSLFFIVENINLKFIQYFAIFGLVSFFLIIFFWKLIEDHILYKYIKQYLKQKYGNIVHHDVSKISNDIISGELFEIGCLRKRYNVIYDVLKYNCSVCIYYLDELRYIGDDKKSFVEKNKYIEYVYDLSILGIENISNELLKTNEIVKEIINLENLKFVEICIQNNCLKITKETVLLNYGKEDAKRDIDDIELFYNKIILNLKK